VIDRRQVADRVARAVRDSPDPWLEKVMHSPARRVVLDGIFWQMPSFLDRKRAAGVTSTVRWEITRPNGGPDVYALEFDGAGCRTRRRPDEFSAPMTITVDGVEFVRIATGSSDPMKAYFSGRLALAGDIMLAAKLVSLFRVPR
jgi:putative sterol carrier protein